MGWVARGVRRGGAGRGARRGSRAAGRGRLGRRAAWRRRLGGRGLGAAEEAASENAASVRLRLLARAKPELPEATGRAARGGDQVARPVLAQRGVREGRVGEEREVPRHLVDVADARVVANGGGEARGDFDAVHLRGRGWEAGGAVGEARAGASKALARAHLIAGSCKWWRAARVCVGGVKQLASGGGANGGCLCRTHPQRWSRSLRCQSTT